MLKLTYFFSTMLLSAGLLQSAQADVQNGRELHADQCIDCHMMRDHSALYTREERMVASLPALGGQVSTCVQALNIDWFPEEEQDVRDYLNATYYKFSK